MEICSHLPMKSLFRSKCVNKRWRDLISSSPFQARMLSLMPGLFIQGKSYYTTTDQERCIHVRSTNTDDETIPDLSLDFLPFQSNFRILDSCNGLLLCQPFHNRKRGNFYICNPLTKTWTNFPRPLVENIHVVNAVLEFDPMSSSSSSSHHFQVFAVCCCLPSNGGAQSLELLEAEANDYVPPCLLLYVFPSRVGEWKKLAIDDERHVDIELQGFRNTVLIDGILYIPMTREYLGAVVINEGSYHAIELPQEGWEPPMYIEEPPYSLLGKSRGDLCFVIHNGFEIHIWLRPSKLNVEGWVLKDRIHLQDLRVKLANYGQEPVCETGPYVFDPLAFHPDLSVVYLKSHCRIFGYDFVKKELEEVCSFKSEMCLTEVMHDTYYDFSVFAYSPCLALMQKL